MPSTSEVKIITEPCTDNTVAQSIASIAYLCPCKPALFNRAAAE